ncbi:hypothetical protein JCM16358_21550 [Halanaerocella petrolearia]
MSKLNISYKDKIKAMEFAVSADDRLDYAKLKEADIILIGVSCTAKTPLSLFLGYQGYKAANVPLVPELDFGIADLADYQNKIIGLTIELGDLKKHRKDKILNLGLSLNTKYVSDSRISNELKYSNQVMSKLRCPKVNVTDKQIEQLATKINSLIDSNSVSP